LGLATYRYDRTERATGLSLNDEVHIIIANCTYKGNDELGRLLRSFVQSDPNKIEDAMVRGRVQYYKQQPEGVREMTSLMEQWRREDFESGRKQGMQQGLEQGLEQGLQDALVSHLRSLVSKLGMPAEEALEALDVPEADRPRYLAML
jgi:flagellar biosynthesis/type III secretory pathway protein FliH